MAGDDEEAAAADADARFNTIERQLTTLATQFQQFTTVLQPGQGQQQVIPPVVAAPTAPTTSQPMRRLDPSVLEKLPSDVSLVRLDAWKKRWADFARLGGLADRPIEDQAALFRLTLDPSMQQVVEAALGILPSDK
jgi:hypothetical protein